MSQSNRGGGHKPSSQAPKEFPKASVEEAVEIKADFVIEPKKFYKMDKNGNAIFGKDGQPIEIENDVRMIKVKVIRPGYIKGRHVPGDILDLPELDFAETWMQEITEDGTLVPLKDTLERIAEAKVTK